jgi:hypothetical protein
MAKNGEKTVQKIMRGQHSISFINFLCGLQCLGNSFAYVAHYSYLRDAWIRTQRAVAASKRATNLAAHLPKNSTRRSDQ